VYNPNSKNYRVWIETGSPPRAPNSKGCSKLLKMEQSGSIIYSFAAK
jgi:hypothetical protein